MTINNQGITFLPCVIVAPSADMGKRRADGAVLGRRTACRVPLGLVGHAQASPQGPQGKRFFLIFFSAIRVIVS